MQEFEKESSRQWRDPHGTHTKTSAQNNNSFWQQLSAPLKTQHVLNQVSAPLEDDTLQDFIQALFAYKYLIMFKEEGTSKFHSQKTFTL